MLSCPLATPSNTLWLTNNHERYWRRFYIAIGLSLALHLCFVVGAWLYHGFYLPVSDTTFNSGTPDLPLRVHLVTESSQAAIAVAQEKIIEPVEETAVVTTTANSSAQTVKKISEEKKPEPIQQEKNNTKEMPKRNVATKDSQGSSDVNASAGAPQKSTIVGANNVITVSAKPRFRTPPKAPEYPQQAQRRRQQGVVYIDFIVEPNGRISAVNVARSSGFPLLDQSAVKAVKQYDLFPHEINGQVVRGKFTVPVKFELK